MAADFTHLSMVQLDIASFLPKFLTAFSRHGHTGQQSIRLSQFLTVKHSLISKEGTRLECNHVVDYILDLFLVRSTV